MNWIQPFSCEFEPSLWNQDTDIENRRPETGARNQPNIAHYRENRVTETRHHLANSRECRGNFCKPDMSQRDGAGWLGRQDSNLGMAESKSDHFSCNINAHCEFSADSPVEVSKS